MFLFLALLDSLCEWLFQNWDQVRRQDVVSMLLCLAALDFLPSGWELLWPKVSGVVQEELRSPSWSDAVLLDVCWSLAVLNHLDEPTARAVLNDAFVSRLLGKL